VTIFEKKEMERVSEYKNGFRKFELFLGQITGQKLKQRHLCFQCQRQDSAHYLERQ
jgi:hypothetical protein